MKRTIALLLVLLFCGALLAGCDASDGKTRYGTVEEGKLIVATNAQFPPYEYYENGKVTGIDIEIAQAIADKLGLELEIADMEFDSIIESVKGGKADMGLAGITVTPEREEEVLFTVSYATGVQVIIVTEDSPITSTEDLFSPSAGYVIGVQRNTTGDLYATQDLEDKGLATVERYNKGTDAVQALSTGKVDCVIIDNKPAQAFAASMEGLKILDSAYAAEDYSAALAKDNEELYNAVNSALQELVEDGTARKIVEKYIPAAGPAELWADTAPQWILQLPQWLEDQCYLFYKCFIYDNRYEMFVQGLGNTLTLTLLALLLGVVLGVGIALVRATWDKNGSQMRGAAKLCLRIANWISNIYLTVIRGTPVVVQLLICWFVIFPSSRNGIMVAALAFGVNSGAYVAEIIRSGIMAVDAGQMEAGRSLGFGYAATMRHIILPQALKATLPTLASEFIVLLKETAVAGYVGVIDLTYAGNIVGGNAYEYLYPLLLTAIIYLVLVMFFTFLVNKLERRLRSSER